MRVAALRRFDPRPGAAPALTPMGFDGSLVPLLRCPISGRPLRLADGALIADDGSARYTLTDSGIPCFGAAGASAAGLSQQAHYERIASAYLENLTYPHTQEYMGYLDDAFSQMTAADPFEVVADICCGQGEALSLWPLRIARGVGVDLSLAMLETAQRKRPHPGFGFVQGDATMLPLASGAFSTAFMFGGIHHVPDRRRLFEEVHRILRPGGRFYWREPVSDFFLWRWIRAVVYRLSPALDAGTEQPLRYAETEPVLREVGFSLRAWRTYGLIGFCLFMNSDVLVFNRAFRHVPGIRRITRWLARLDDRMTRWPPLSRAGLQVIGAAQKPG